MKLKNWAYLPIYILLAALCIASSIFLRNSWLNSRDFGKYTIETSKRLNKEINHSNLILLQLSSMLKKSKGMISFTDLTAPYKYPVYIFEEKELIYWSDYQYEISYEDIRSNFPQFCIDTKNGIFLVSKERLPYFQKTLEVVVLIPIYLQYSIDNQYIINGTNPNIFPDNQVKVSNMPESSYQVSSPTGKFLFSIIFPDYYFYAAARNDNLIILLGGIGFLLILLDVFLRVRRMVLLGTHGKAFLGLGFSLFLIRGSMLIFRLPYRLIELDIFSSKFYASSVLAPSLGDLFLNILGIFILISFLFLYLHKIWDLQNFASMSSFQKMTISISLICGSFWVLFWHYSTLKMIYLNSQISLDITQDINFDVFKIISLFIFVITAVSYFFLIHSLGRMVHKMNLSPQRIIIAILVGSTLYMLTAILTATNDTIILSVHLIFISLVLVLNMPQMLNTIGSPAFLYLFLATVVCALVGTYGVYNFEKERENNSKQKLATKLLIENDLLGENLLSELTTKIPNDPIIKNRLLSPFSAKEIIIKKVMRFYLGSYFDKYDVSVFLFDGNGEAYDYDFTYDSLKNQYATKDFATEYENVFFIHDIASNTKRYMTFIEVQRNGVGIGKIIIDLKMKKIVQNSVYPNLLLDKRFRENQENSQISYAIFGDNTLLYSFGDFLYDNSILQEFDSTHYRRELNLNDFRHLFIRGDNKKIIIITSKDYPFQTYLSNFSFFFLVVVAFLAVLMQIYRKYFRKTRFQYSFSARIQLYLNMAFLLPLSVVSIWIVSILNTENKEEIIKDYYLKAENVSTNLSNELQRYTNGIISKDKLLESVGEIARLVQTEIDLFDSEGKLIVSSQPAIYENNLLSSLINPNVISAIVEQRQPKIILNEVVGKLNYTSAYMAIRSYETGEMLGIIGIPFFESQYQAEEEIKEIISMIINVFTITIIVLSVLAYLASRLLTEPLKLITEKLQKVTLSSHNEPIEYASSDEIGLLVGEYNKMLVKLEESRAALSQSEKESAWREMAKQVAHEIKNPLTPMKLTLQHLQRIAVRENPIFERPINTLLTQIETLSDIASSFSAFAKMPTPENEVFDLCKVVSQTVFLHKSNENVNINAQIQLGELWVNADSKLMGRIITNLILNAIQACEGKERADIFISLQAIEKQTKALFLIRDNGKGIPEEFQQKVFMPNFTTKTTGSGIGLAVAKRGIEHAGGNIWFETEEEKGTAFFIELPLLKH